MAEHLLYGGSIEVLTGWRSTKAASPMDALDQDAMEIC